MHDKNHMKTVLFLSLANGKQTNSKQTWIPHLLFNLLDAFAALIIALASVLL